MNKEEFLRLFNECLEDGSIFITTEHTEKDGYDWQTTNLSIEINIGGQPTIFHNFKGN